MSALTPPASITKSLLTCAYAVDLQSGTVDDEVQWLAGVQHWQRDLQCLCATARGRVVGHRQVREGKLAQAQREPLQRAQWQVKDLLEAEQHLYERIRVDARAATNAFVQLARRRE